MKVEIFSLSDFASADAGGKLNIIGVFNTIFAGQLPAAQALCVLAIRMRFERIEAGFKKLKIAFVDADGRAVMPVIDTQIHVQLPPDSPFATAHLCLTMQQIKLPNFGEYSIDLAVDGKQEASTPLYVRMFPD